MQSQETMAEEWLTDVKGHCYCGAVEYSVKLAAGESPLFPPVYCHCDSCRRAHSAPLYHVVCIDMERSFEITKGQEHIKNFMKPNTSNGITRCFCDVCGSKIYNLFDPTLPFFKDRAKKPMVFFPDTLESKSQGSNLPACFRPVRHHHVEECVLDLNLLKTLLDANNDNVSDPSGK